MEFVYSVGREGFEMITGSIALFNNDEEVLAEIIRIINLTPSFAKLYLVDNSPNNELRNLVHIAEDKVEYIHNPSNPGFGAAHNLALTKAAANGSAYHFVINPDVQIDMFVIEQLLSYLESNDDVGMVMPQILNEDGTVQLLPKLLPSPFSIIMRVLNKKRGWFASYVSRYELREFNSSRPINVPVLSGCFTLFRTSALQDIGLYDDAFFMYFEDWDISRRMHQKYKTIYYPKVTIVHGYESGANKSTKLFRVFVKSAVYYFNKWGWFFDTERKRVNKAVLKEIKRS